MNLEQSLNESKRMLALGKLALARKRVLDFLERHAETYRVLHLLANRRVPDSGAAGLSEFIDQALVAFANEPVATAVDHDMDYAHQVEQRIHARRRHFYIDPEREDVEIRGADSFPTQDGTDSKRPICESSITHGFGRDHLHSLPTGIEPDDLTALHVLEGRLTVVAGDPEPSRSKQTIVDDRSPEHPNRHDRHEEEAELAPRSPEPPPAPEREDGVVNEHDLEIVGEPVEDFLRRQIDLVGFDTLADIEEHVTELENPNTAQAGDFSDEANDDWLLDEDEDPVLDQACGDMDDDLGLLEYIDTDYDPHASTQEDLFDSVLIQGVVPRHERALQVAQQLAMPHGWDADGIRLLAEIFEQHGWSACQRSMRRELENGLAVHELEAAFECRELWSNHPEFSARLIRRRTRQRSTRVGTSDYYKTLSWPDALRLVRSFPGRSDCAEIEYFLLEAYDHWYGAPALWSEFESFRAYLLMQLSRESDNDQPWVSGLSEYSSRVRDFEWEVDLDWPVWDPRHQRLELLCGLSH